MCQALSTNKYVPCWCLWYYIHCNMILRNSQAGRDYDCNMFVAITLKSADEVCVLSRKNEHSVHV
jgi:hypothetical protein